VVLLQEVAKEFLDHNIYPKVAELKEVYDIHHQDPGPGRLNKAGTAILIKKAVHGGLVQQIEKASYV